MKVFKPCLRMFVGFLVLWPTLSWLEAQETAPTTAMLEVDRIRIRVLTTGLDDREPGQAVVVFEGGGGASLETWNPIMPAVSTLAPVVAYDRAGTGESEWDGLPPTPERVGMRLRKVLAQLRVAPPYILVGHSWGGVLVRYFAAANSEEVAGVLYIDPTDITLSPEEELAIFESIGADRSARDAFYEIQERAMANASGPLRAETTVILDLMRLDPAERGLLPAADVPTSVIVAGRAAVFPPNVLPFDTAAYAAAIQENRVQRLRSWAIAPGEYIVASNSGHSVHAEDANLVIEAIRHLIRNSP
jgi:pimeloyl-ACP methyl ester carboxylesterase